MNINVLRSARSRRFTRKANLYAVRSPITMIMEENSCAGLELRCAGYMKTKNWNVAKVSNIVISPVVAVSPLYFVEVQYTIKNK